MDVIIRFSLDGDRGSRLRNKLKQVLANGNINWDSSTTATYRGWQISPADLSNTLSLFWDEVHSDKRKVSFDHFWMYSDNPSQQHGETLAGLNIDEFLEVDSSQDGQGSQ